QADLMRWFPILDHSGDPIPYVPRTKQKWLLSEELHEGQWHLAANAGYPCYIGGIHMINRQIGWAQNVSTLIATNDWITEQSAILRTTNGGASWKTVLCASPEDDVASFARDKDTAWVTAVYDESTNVTVLRTTDGGLTWRRAVLNGPYAIEDCELFFPAADQGRILLIPDHGMNSMPGYLYGWGYGDDWQLINSTENSGNYRDDSDGSEPGFADRHPYLICGGSIAFQDMTNGWLLGQMTTTTRPFLFFTRDGGVNWQEQKFELPQSLHDGSIVPQKLPEFFGRDGIVETSFVPSDGEATNDYAIFYKTRDSGETWQPATPVKSIGVYSFISSKNGWDWCPQLHDSNSTAPARGTLYRTVDGAERWTAVNMKESLENYLTRGQSIIQLDFVDDAYGWAIAQDWRNQTQLLKTTDGGETWTMETP
ncbi:MAG: hypothetical protein ACREE6_15565, partial [Limisphaerales bacterium]